MHAYILTRGHKDRVDRWVNDCLAKYYPYTIGWVGSKPVPARLQLVMRPIQLWEVVFPAECREQVISDLQINGEYGMKDNVSNLPLHIIQKATQILASCGVNIRELKEIKPVPKTDNGIIGTGVDVYGLGTIEDDWLPFSRENI